MSATKIKELIFVILFIIINTIIAFYITYSLGVSNTVIYRSITSIISEITWEIVIFMGLSIIETSIYELSQIRFKLYE